MVSFTHHQAFDKPVWHHWYMTTPQPPRQESNPRPTDQETDCNLDTLTLSCGDTLGFSRSCQSAHKLPGIACGYHCTWLGEHLGNVHVKLPALDWDVSGQTGDFRWQWIASRLSIAQTYLHTLHNWIS